MTMLTRAGLLFLLLSTVLLTAQTSSVPAGQQMSSLRRDQALRMLHEARETIKKEYYDPKLHGIDLDGRVGEAEKKIRSVTSISDAFGVIAWTLEALNDSHTFFIPPPRPYDLQNGWELGFVGDNCYITAVQPTSDAAAKGIKPGDQVLAIEGFRPTRDNLWKLRYAFNTLAPRSAMHLVLASPNAQPPRQLEVNASVTALRQRLGDTNDIWDIIRKQENREQEVRIRWAEIRSVFIMKIPAFLAEDSKIDELIGRARGHNGLILDLRNNAGGSEDLLLHLLSRIFEHDVKVAERRGRKEQKSRIAKSHGDRAFTGKLIVLIDSASASAAEVLARTVQLEKRGTVMGDRSSGSVMEARIFPYSGGIGGDFSYGFEVTVSDLIMADGGSLEHVGVTPDELLLPSPEDMAAGRDPVLAKAIQSLGEKISPEEAGRFFPLVWHKPGA